MTTAIKTASPGDLVSVPCVLAFPQRTGRWSRHLYTLGRVIRTGVGNKTGAPVILVRYAAISYLALCEKWFLLSEITRGSEDSLSDKERDRWAALWQQ